MSPHPHRGVISSYAGHDRGCCSGQSAYTAVEPETWFHPVAVDFMAEHPRWITLPETTLDYASQPAIRFQLADAASAARLTVLAAQRTRRILATLPE